MMRAGVHRSGIEFPLELYSLCREEFRGLVTSKLLETRGVEKGGALNLISIIYIRNIVDMGVV